MSKNKTRRKNSLVFKNVKDLVHNQDYSFFIHTNIVGCILIEEHQFHYVMWKEFLDISIPSNVLTHLIDDLELLKASVKFDNEVQSLAKLIKKAKSHKAYKPKIEVKDET